MEEKEIIVTEAEFVDNTPIDTECVADNEEAPVEVSEEAPAAEEAVGAQINAFDAEASAFYESGLITSRERYSALRSMGLSAREAYLATGTGIDRESTKAHLVSSVPSPATAPAGAMSTQEMDAARSLFEGMSDADIRKLYNKVTR